MSGASTAALLAMFPSPDHNELGVGLYGHDVAQESLLPEALPGAEGLEIMGRRVFDTLANDITGTGENFRLRMYRDADGLIQLDTLTYDSLLFSVRVRPELGDSLDIGALFGTWEEVWAWDTGRAQWRFFTPLTLTGLGFSNTDQDDDTRLKHYVSAGAGAGGEVHARAVGPFGIQLRAEGKARTTNRHRGGEANEVRHETRAYGEVGVSYIKDSQAWVVGSWVEQITQWDTRDADGRDGVDRQYFAAGMRLSARFYKGSPVTDLEEEMVDLDMLLDALRTREEVLAERSEAIDRETGAEDSDVMEELEAMVAAGVLEEEDPKGLFTLIHWSELNFAERVDPDYPEGALEAGTCTVRLFVDADGAPSDVRAESCTEPWLRPAMQAVWQWKFEPILEDGEAIPVQFLYTLDFELPEPSP